MPIILNPKTILRASYESLKADCLDFHKILKQLYERFDDILPLIAEYCADEELITLFVDVYRRSKDECKSLNKPEVVIVRNDLMFDAEKGDFLQIEYNTISCGFGQMGSKIVELQRLVHFNEFQTPLNFVPCLNSQQQV